MYNLRVAIWAAVSKDEQAIDKASIPAQIETRKATERVETVLRMRDLIPVLPVWLVETDPAEVRYHLSRTVKIVMNTDKTVKVELL